MGILPSPPKKRNTGSLMSKTVSPVHANTTRIMITCKALSTFHLSLSLRIQLTLISFCNAGGQVMESQQRFIAAEVMRLTKQIPGSNFRN